ncbi:MAG: hypothetical protein AAF847_09375 [Bacteroidota bacterium]
MMKQNLKKSLTIARLPLWFCCLIGLLFSLLQLSCEEPPPSISKEELIAQEVQKRLKRLIKNKSQRCNQELMDQANIIVDSILIARAKADKDTIPKPPKPFKPEQPDAFLLEDTFAIRPLLLDTLPVDSTVEQIDSLQKQQ